jgi:hypothetical protein
VQRGADENVAEFKREFSPNGLAELGEIQNRVVVRVDVEQEGDDGLGRLLAGNKRDDDQPKVSKVVVRWRPHEGEFGRFQEKGFNANNVEQDWGNLDALRERGNAEMCDPKFQVRAADDLHDERKRGLFREADQQGDRDR